VGRPLNQSIEKKRTRSLRIKETLGPDNPEKSDKCTVKGSERSGGKSLGGFKFPGEKVGKRSTICRGMSLKGRGRLADSLGNERRRGRCQRGNELSESFERKGKKKGFRKEKHANERRKKSYGGRKGITSAGNLLGRGNQQR